MWICGAGLSCDVDGSTLETTSKPDSSVVERDAASAEGIDHIGVSVVPEPESNAMTVSNSVVFASTASSVYYYWFD